MRHFAPTHRRFQRNLRIPPDIFVSATAADVSSKDRPHRSSCRPFPDPSRRNAESAPGRFRFSIKRKDVAPKETPHPENPVCNKRRSGYTRHPNHHSIHLKYHRNGTLSSLKPPKTRFFCVFRGEKAAFSFFLTKNRAGTTPARDEFYTRCSYASFLNLRVESSSVKPQPS